MIKSISKQKFRYVKVGEKWECLLMHEGKIVHRWAPLVRLPPMDGIANHPALRGPCQMGLNSQSMMVVGPISQHNIKSRTVLTHMR